MADLGPATAAETWVGDPALNPVNWSKMVVPSRAVRFFHVQDPEFWVPGDMAASIQNAIDATDSYDPVTQTGTGGVTGVIVIPPGKWQLSQTIATAKANIEIIGGGGAEGSEIKTPGTDPYGFVSGPPSVELVAPSGQGAFRLGRADIANQFSGPKLRNLVVTSYQSTVNSPFGIWFDRVNNFYCERVFTKGFAASGAEGWRFNSAPGSTIQYGTLVDCGDFNSRVGMEFKDGSGIVMLGCRLFGNGGAPVTSATGTMGIRAVSNNGSLQCFGLRIQGYDTLVRLDSDMNSIFSAGRYEGWYSRCFDIGRSIIADRVEGTQIIGGSWGNFGQTRGPVFDFGAGVDGEPLVYATNVVGGNPIHRDLSGKVGGLINGQVLFGKASDIAYTGPAARMVGVQNGVRSYGWFMAQDRLGWGDGDNASTLGTLRRRLPAYDKLGNHIGWIPVYDNIS